MGARLLIGTRWFGRAPEDELDPLRVRLATAVQQLVLLEARHAELQAGQGALRAITGAILMRIGGQARLHQADITLAIQVMNQGGGLVVTDEPGGFVSVRVGQPSRIIVPGSRVPRG